MPGKLKGGKGLISFELGGAYYCYPFHNSLRCENVKFLPTSLLFCYSEILGKLAEFRLVYGLDLEMLNEG